MHNSELLVSEIGLLDEGGLQSVEDHAQRRRGGRPLTVILVGLAVDVLLEYDVRANGKGTFKVFGDGDDRDAFCLANIEDGEQFLRLAAAGGKHHHVALLQKAGRAVYRLGGRDEA